MRMGGERYVQRNTEQGSNRALQGAGIIDTYTWVSGTLGYLK